MNPPLVALSHLPPAQRHASELLELDVESLVDKGTIYRLCLKGWLELSGPFHWQELIFCRQARKDLRCPCVAAAAMRPSTLADMTW